VLESAMFFLLFVVLFAAISFSLMFEVSGFTKDLYSFTKIAGLQHIMLSKDA
jgi:hypothetical protein